MTILGIAATSAASFVIGVLANKYTDFGNATKAKKEQEDATLRRCLSALEAAYKEVLAAPGSYVGSDEQRELADAAEGCKGIYGTTSAGYAFSAATIFDWAARQSRLTIDQRMTSDHRASVDEFGQKAIVEVREEIAAR